MGPKTLTTQMMEYRVSACRELLAIGERVGADFLQLIVTGDEFWFEDYDPACKRGSMEWGHPNEAPRCKPKSQVSAGKKMATIFWDTKGILLIKWLPQGRTINADYSCEILAELPETVKKKRRGKLSKGVFLLYDNARPHTAEKTPAAINDAGFTPVPHPPYFPDLAPNNYWLFGPMKKHVRGRGFHTLQQLATALRKWRQQTPEEWFAKGMAKLTQRWQRCVELKGE